MQQRQYKDSGEHISLLGFGCMRFPVIGGDDGEIDEKSAREMIDCAIAGGVNYFDTAYFYHKGNSERFIGKALRSYPRESFKLADKMPPWLLHGKADVERIFNEQLKKCQVEYFDYYLVHNISSTTMPAVEKYEVYDFLREMQRQGRLRRLGFSFHDTPAVLKKALERWEWDFAQIQLNYLDWDMQDARGQYSLLEERGIPVIVMEPVRGGALASLCEKSVDILNKADPLASTASWAMRFAASLPGALTVLSGMSSLEQVKDNIATISGFKPLTDRENDTIKEAVDVYRKNSAIPCTACGYCMDCPGGVNIPLVFGTYNQYRHNSRESTFLIDYQAMGDAGAKSCTACGQCTAHCPQSIDIPQWMQTVDALAGELSAKES